MPNDELINSGRSGKPLFGRLQTYLVPHTFRSGIPVELCHTLLRGYEPGGEYHQFELLEKCNERVYICATTASCLQFVIRKELIELQEALESIQAWQESNNSKMIDEVELMLRDILTKHLKVQYSKYLLTCNNYLRIY